ncbi:MAG: cytochrome c biogenesis protein CcdA [bacterium]
MSERRLIKKIAVFVALFGALVLIEPSLAAGAREQGGEVAAAIAEKGLFLTLLGVFIGGVLLSFTPCLYPMIPITLSVIGARSVGKPVRGFLLSLMFVLGMVLVYSVLGVTAALAGSAFGSLLQSPVLLSAVVILFVALALSMFGLFEIALPPRIAGWFSGTGPRGGFLGAFVLGAVAGIVASPCSSPVLASLLIHVGQTRDPWMGFLLFFTLASGMGVLFVVLGTFPSFLTSMPKAGPWMEEVKKVLGVTLIGAALYYTKIILYHRDFYFYLVLGITLWTLAIGAGLLSHLEGFSKGIRTWRRVAAVVMLLAGAYVVFVLSPAAARQRMQIGAGPEVRTVGDENSWDWIHSEVEGLKLAAAEKRPAIIDFFAEWCAPCKELDEKTFSNSEVIEAGKDFVHIKVDLTQLSDENVELMEKYKVQTIPTVIFINKEGVVRKDLTLRHYEGPEKFVERLKQVGAAELSESSHALGSTDSQNP